MNSLRKIRVTLALLFGVGITLLFLDFTGALHNWLGWMAKIQLLPALLSLNVGVVLVLVLLTLLMGRVYCSVICPFGVLQDVISHTNRKKNRYRYSAALNWLRYGVLALFVILFLLGVGSAVALLEPYSAYGRIVSTLLAPIYQWGNNLLAYIAERADSYAFYQTQVWVRSIGTLAVASVTLVVIAIVAWRSGRTYCNTVCPVGTVLGFVSRFSLYKHRIDTDKCNSCGLCAHNCKASCIDGQNHAIDYSRCVACFDCIDKCKQKAITYSPLRKRASESKTEVDESRRKMLTLAGALVATSIAKAQEKKVDGGLAFIEDKKIPVRQTPIAPPGSGSIRNFSKRCTGCQLCVSACPNHVLRPSSDLTTFMQPELSFERGYCRPECTKCSEVCPSGAIKAITTADRSATQVGHAVWIEKNCIVLTDGVKCGNCARHCPAAAIVMVDRQAGGLSEQLVPVVNIERCIGCGACEHLCPARPFSAIYVDGHIEHRIV